MKKNDERDERKTRKVLVPLATLAVATAVAVGSGATWTSTSTNHVSVTGGKLVHVNNHDNGTLTVEHLKPGASVFGTVTISEDAANDVDSDLKLVASNVSSGFTAGDLLIRIDGNGVHTGDLRFESLNAANSTIALGQLLDGYGSQDFTITVSMPTTAGNEDQGKAASADLQFLATQTADPSTNTTVTWK